MPLANQQCTRNFETWNLDPEKVVGDENINPAILRNVADQFAVPLSIIFTTRMKAGKIPKDWRTANLTPIYKI